MDTHHDIHHSADLARIALTPQEEERFQKELLGILEFVATLNEVDTSNVEPLNGGTITVNKMRKDTPFEQTDIKKDHALISAAPEQRDGWIKVKPVFE